MVPLYYSLSSSSFSTAMPKSARGRQKLNTFSIPNCSKSIHDYFTNKLWIINRLYGALSTVRTIFKLQSLALKRSKCCKIIRSKGRNKNHNRKTQEHFSNVMHLKLQGMYLHGEAISLASIQWYIGLQMTGYCRCRRLIMRKNWRGQYFGPRVNSTLIFYYWLDLTGEIKMLEQLWNWPITDNNRLQFLLLIQNLYGKSLSFSMKCLYGS